MSLVPRNPQMPRVGPAEQVPSTRATAFPGNSATFAKNRKPAGASGGLRSFSLTNREAVEKSYLRSSSRVLPSVLIIRDCALHEKDGRRWFQRPTEERFTRTHEQIERVPIPEFAYTTARERFLALEALAAASAKVAREAS